MVNPYPRHMETWENYTEEDFAPFLILENVNTSGQGFGPYHADNPYHAMLTELGFAYSHTTPITNVDGSKRAHLTYRHASLPNFAVGIDCRPGFMVSAGKGGSGYRHTMFGVGNVRHYLKRKLREQGK